MEEAIEVSGPEFWSLTQKAAQLDAVRARLSPALAEYREALKEWQESLSLTPSLEKSRAVGMRLREAEARILSIALVWLGGEA